MSNVEALVFDSPKNNVARAKRMKQSRHAAALLQHLK